MPDWFVKRNSPDSFYPYSVRLGGCEYSLTEEDWAELFDAFFQVNQTEAPLCVESEDYQDLVISYSDNKPRLLDILKIEKPVINRRGM